MECKQEQPDTAVTLVLCWIFDSGVSKRDRLENPLRGIFNQTLDALLCKKKWITKKHFLKLILFIFYFIYLSKYMLDYCVDIPTPYCHQNRQTARSKISG